MAKQQWAIVGGGMMGLTLAHLLSKAGQRVSIFEARPTVGGLADAWSLGDVTWDRHYHVTLLSDTRLRQLIEEIGLTDDLRWVETKTGFFTNGKFYSMSSTTEFLQFPPLGLIEKLRLGGTIFLASKLTDWQRLEEIPVAQWLKRWSGEGTFQKIWLPLLRAKLGESYRRTSAAFIWAHINRMYKARRTGLKKEMFGYVKGGYARLLEALSDSLLSRQVSILTHQRIASIDSNPNPQIHFQDGTTEEFDRVILTTAPPITASLCPNLKRHEHQQFQDIEYLGIVCASVLLKRPLNGYYVTNITDDAPFTAVIEMSTIVDREELGGHTLVYLPKYVTADDPTVTMADDEVQERFLAGLRRMYPDLQDEDIAAFRISRVKHVMAIPTLNYSKTLPPVVTSLDGVYAINSAHILKGNLNVNETITLAEEMFHRELLPLIEFDDAGEEHRAGAAC